MSQTEVFRPSNGALLVRSTMADGNQGPTESSRPVTQGGYRFGQLSRNSFFTRHNPHPHRVRHIKGLLDVPICAVNDNGYFSSPRYSLNFPPNSFNEKKLSASWSARIPVNAINVNSQLHPINTITGLQYFTGLRSFPWREKAVPKMGLVPVTEAWRDELKRMTEAAGLATQTEVNPTEDLDQRPKTQNMYSSETGRLIPPPSRAMSRGASRRGNRFPTGLQHIATEPDMESVVMTMLCQILQTDDINAVQAWLCSAGEREKNIVLDLIRSATASKEEYYKQYPTEFIEPPPLNRSKSALPPIGETNGIAEQENDDVKFDRLTLTDNDEEQVWGSTWPLHKPHTAILTEEDEVNNIRPPTSDVFRKPEMSKVRMISPPKSPSKQQGPENSEARLCYTKSSQKDTSTEGQIKDWNQEDSVTAANTL